VSLIDNSPGAAEADHRNNDWQAFRGLAGKPNAPQEKRKRLLRIAAAAVLTMAVIVGLVIIVLKFRDRIPSLASSARAEVAVLASKFRSDPSTGREAPATRAIQSTWQPPTGGRRRRAPRRGVTMGSSAPPRFDAYLVLSGRRVLLRSDGEMALVDMRTGYVERIPADDPLR
jgi:hypothetical protein